MKLLDLKEKDLTALKTLRNQYKQYLRQKDILRELDQKRWYESNYFNDNKVFGIYHDNFVFVGCCALTNIDWTARHSEISIIMDNYINEKSYEVVKMIEDIAKNEYNLVKLYINVYANDEKKIEMCKHCNYLLDAVIPEFYYYNGKYYDYLIHSKKLGV